MVKKIDLAVVATAKFIGRMHRVGMDRGAILTFGENFRVAQGLTTNVSQLGNALKGINADGSWTRLYDSSADAVDYLINFGKRNRPWLITVVTDGKDNKSSKFKKNPSAAGRYIWNRYNHEKSNFISVIGVGSGSEIDENALVQMANAGRFRPMNINGFYLLEAVYMQIAVQFTSAIVGQRISMQGMTWQRLGLLRARHQIAFDYAFVIDKSASMSSNA